MAMDNVLLKIQDLKVAYKIDNRLVEIVRGVDIAIEKGNCMGLVGESGCGKTTVGLSITKLIPEHKGIINSGRILFNGNDILKLNPEELRKIRGKKISYVFQEPFSSLNPVFTVYEQLREVLGGQADVEKAITEILRRVGLDRIAGRKKIYPHELSGGMQQRVVIAMAVLSKPGLVIMDEPTTALDITIQNQILNLIMELKSRMNLSILFISHDLRIVFRIADRISVMYAGKIVEEGSKEDVMHRPIHPYTRGLIDSVPSIEHRKKRFNAIDGKAPLFSELPQGCKFYPRCRFRIDECRELEPELEEIGGGHRARCIRWQALSSISNK